MADSMCPYCQATDGAQHHKRCARYRPAKHTINETPDPDHISISAFIDHPGNAIETARIVQALREARKVLGNVMDWYATYEVDGEMPAGSMPVFDRVDVQLKKWGAHG